MSRVVALVRSPQSPFELACVAEVFGLAGDEFGVCSEQPGGIDTTAGYQMLVPDGLAALDQADSVIVPGWLPVDETPSPEVLAALRRAHQRGARIASICTGVYPLAHAGLLDGRRATTHWLRTGDLAARFPEVDVDADVLYVDHGDVATSAGAGAGIDLCLHLVRCDHGARHASDVARRMVMPPHREGGQLQYATAPHAPAARAELSLAPLLDWAVEHLADPIGTGELAARVGVSARTLARRFNDELGVPPGQWLLERRLDAARELLEVTDLPVDTVARRAGLASATNLRRRFLNALNTTPSAYRRAFRARSRSRTPSPGAASLVSMSSGLWSQKVRAAR